MNEDSGFMASRSSNVGETRPKAAEFCDSETELLRRVRERLKAAEEDVARIASENARLVTENTALRAKLAPNGARSKRRLRSVA